LVGDCADITDPIISPESNCNGLNGNTVSIVLLEGENIGLCSVGILTSSCKCSET